MAATDSSSMPTRRVGWYSIALHIALVVLAVQVVIMSRPKAPPPPIEAVAEGDTLEPMAVRALDGSERTLQPSGGRDTLLLVFTTTCPACRENAPTWAELAARVGDDYEIVGLSLDDPEATRAYAAEQGFRFPIVVPRKVEGFARRHGIPAVPHTLWIGDDGAVRASWVGQLDAEQVATLTTPVERASAATTDQAPRDV